MAGGMGQRVKGRALGLIIIAGALLRLRGFMNPLLDNQAWRQADTASMALNMLGSLTSIPEVWVPRLLYDGPAPQNVELEFPFLPYLMAWTSTIFGWSDQWGRLWAIFFSLLALVGIYDIGREAFSKRAGLFAAAFYAVAPLSIYYGRVVMPEPVAQAASVWALSLALRWRNRGKRGIPIGAALMLAGAILAKLPQLMLFPVASFLAFWPWKSGNMRRFGIYSLVSLFFPVLYYGWVHFQAKGARQFVSGILRNQVVNAAVFWEPLQKNLQQGLNPWLIALAVLGTAVLLAVPRSKDRFSTVAFVSWLGISTAYVIIVCGRIPLDYYLVPLLPILSLLAGYALDRLTGIPGEVLAVVFSALIAFQAWAVLTPKYAWDQRTLEQALWLRSQLKEGQTLLLSDDRPMSFYYARTAGWRLHGGRPEDLLKQIKTTPAEFFVLIPGSELPFEVGRTLRQDYPEEAPGIFRLKGE